MLYRRQIKELEKFHQRQLRKILGIKWDDYTFQTRRCSRIETAIEKIQLRWIGHVRRMEENQLSKVTLYGELEHGERLFGGQRKRYRD